MNNGGAKLIRRYVKTNNKNSRRFGQGGGLGLGKSSDFPNSAMPPGVSKTDATMRKRAIPAVLTGDVPVAVKVIRDVSRQSLRRFWFEVLIMKVSDVSCGNHTPVTFIPMTWGRSEGWDMVVIFVSILTCPRSRSPICRTYTIRTSCDYSGRRGAGDD